VVYDLFAAAELPRRDRSGDFPAMPKNKRAAPQKRVENGEFLLYKLFGLLYNGQADRVLKAPRQAGCLRHAGAFFLCSTKFKYLGRKKE